MGWERPAYLWFCIAIAALLAASSLYLVWRPRLLAARTGALLLVAGSGWLLGSALSAASQNLTAKVFWYTAQHLAINAVPVLWLVIGLQFAGRKVWLTPRTIALLAAEPVIALLLMWTNPAHGWMWVRLAPVPAGPFTILAITHGPAYWIHSAYSYGLILAGSALLVRTAAQSPTLYRRRIMAILALMILPATLNVLWLAGVNPWPPVDLAAMAFALAGLALALGYYGLMQRDILPIARGAVIEGMRDGVIVLDTHDRIVDLNPAARALFGDATGRSASAIWPAWPQVGEADLATNQGPRTYDLSLSPITDRFGRRAGQVAVLRDVTRRKQVETALEDSEAKYRAAVEQSADCIYLMDVDRWCLLEANDSLQALLGYSAEELAGMPITAFVDHPESDIAAKLQEVLERGRLFLGERQYRLKDGTRLPVEVSGSLITYRGQKALCVVSRDISQRKQAAQALEQHNRRLQSLHTAAQALNASLRVEQVLPIAMKQLCSLLEVSICSVWLIDPGTEELVCRETTNPCPGRILGRRLAKGQGLVGHVAECSESLIVADAPSDERYIRDLARESGVTPRSVLAVPLILKGQVLGVLLALDTVPGRFQPADLMIAQSFAESAAIALENARLYEDLQHRIQELRTAQTRLVQAEKMAAFGELAAGVAHELNNPLTPVLGFAELLLERVAPDQPGYRELSIIAAEAHRAREIVLSLLDFSRQGKFYAQPTDPNQIVRETLALVRQQLAHSHIAVREDCSAAVPALLLDPSRVKQALLALIANAAQAMPEGGTLVLATERVGDQVALRVSDTGTGIAPEHLPHIFEPFFTTRPEGQGTGLGLAVCLGIVQDHQGHIAVESTPGVGSCFTIWLPMAAGL